MARVNPHTRLSVPKFILICAISCCISVANAATSPAPTANFLAAPDNGVFIPPDTDGAVGPHHLVVLVNGTFQVQDRSGNVLTSKTLDQFWSSVYTPPPSGNTFDPVVEYDPFNDRFIAVTNVDATLSTSSVLIGCSQTGDPTGTWNMFKFKADPGSTNWADHPKMGFNRDWVVVSENMFQNAGAGSFVEAKIFVFTKSQLYNNTLSSARTFLDTSGASTIAPAVTYDNTIDTLYLVDNGDAATHLRINSISGAIDSETYTQGIGQPGGGSWSDSPVAANFAPQLGSATAINCGDSRIINAVYRNGSLWCAHTIFLPAGGFPNRSSVQWWQFTPGGTVQQRGVIDDPSAVNFYAYPSIGVNKFNDVLVGYSHFSSSMYATAEYAYRSAGDPVSTLEAPQTLKAGLTSYVQLDSNNENRWGDYSQTVVDPVNDTDLWTIQEFAASPANTWGTWWGQVHLTTTLPVITSPTTAAGVAGQPFSYTITATGGSLTFGATGLTSEFQIDPSSGIISGTPASPETLTVTITATNATGSASQTLTITIFPVLAFNSPIQATPIPGIVGKPETFTCFPNISTAVITWDFGDGVTSNGNPVTHIYSAPGTYSVTATANHPPTSQSLQSDALSLLVESNINLVQPAFNPKRKFSVTFPSKSRDMFDITITSISSNGNTVPQDFGITGVIKMKDFTAQTDGLTLKIFLGDYQTQFDSVQIFHARGKSSPNGARAMLQWNFRKQTIRYQVRNLNLTTLLAPLGVASTTLNQNVQVPFFVDINGVRFGGSYSFLYSARRGHGKGVPGL